MGKTRAVTLGYSRRTFVRASPCEKQQQRLATFEDAFRYFDGLPAELLIDNARAMVRVPEILAG